MCKNRIFLKKFFKKINIYFDRFMVQSSLVKNESHLQLCKWLLFLVRLNII